MPNQMRLQTVARSPLLQQLMARKAAQGPTNFQGQHPLAAAMHGITQGLERRALRKAEEEKQRLQGEANTAITQAVTGNPLLQSLTAQSPDEFSYGGQPAGPQGLLKATMMNARDASPEVSAMAQGERQRMLTAEQDELSRKRHLADLASERDFAIEQFNRGTQHERGMQGDRFGHETGMQDTRMTHERGMQSDRFHDQAALQNDEQQFRLQLFDAETERQEEAFMRSETQRAMEIASGREFDREQFKEEAKLRRELQRERIDAQNNLAEMQQETDRLAREAKDEKDRRNVEKGLRAEYQSASKDFIGTVDSFDSMFDLAINNDTGPGHIAMLFKFIKLVDPTARAVTDADFRVAESAQPFLERWGFDWKLHKAAWEGKKVGRKTIAKFIDIAKTEYESRLQSHLDTEQYYRERATGYGVDVDNVVREYRAKNADTVYETVTDGVTRTPREVDDLVRELTEK